MKAPTPENIDYWLFDWVEGNLSAEQEEQLRIFLLLNPEYELDAEAWKQANTTFPEVSEAHVAAFGFTENAIPAQKEKRRKIAPIWWASSATFVIGFLVFTFWPSLSHKTKDPNVASVRSHTRDASIKRDVISSRNAEDKRTTMSHPTDVQKTMLWLAKGNVSHLASFGNNAIENSSIEPELSLDHAQQESIEWPSLSIKSKRSPLALGHEAAIDATVESTKVRTKASLASRLKLNKSSALGKYLHQEGVSSTIRDRVYCVPEKSPLDLNEGLVGNRSQARFQATTFARDVNGPNEKITQQLAYDTYLRNLKSGIGIVANYAQFGKGVVSEWNVKIIYSPKIALSRYVSLEPSLSYTMGQKQLDFSKVNNYTPFTYESQSIQTFQYDPSLPVGRSLIYRDLSAGAMLNLGPLYVGGKVDNLLQHQDNIHTNDFDTIVRARASTTLLLGTDFSGRNGKIVFSPLVSHWTNGQNQLTQWGATLQMNRWVIGANTSSQKALGGLLGYQGENVAMFLQSSKSTSILTQQPVYLHQITVRFNSNISRKARRYLYL
ncbi:MAG: type IX secretion system membrane protein PorP/SprF [Flavobacteriales bacterium]